MERVVMGNHHATCGAGEKPEITSNAYLSLFDGGHPDRKMDWPTTQNYVKAFAEAEGVTKRISRRANGFWGEVYRVGASYPIEYEGEDGSIQTCSLTKNQVESERLREQILREAAKNFELTKQLKEYGYRMKFPAKSGNLARRWCSAYLKIDVANTVIRNLELIGKIHKFPAKGTCHQGRWCSGTLKADVQSGVMSNLRHTRENTNILIVSGERRGESSGRSKYNEMEIHRTNATKRAHRLVHQWRAVIDYTERDVWEVLRRHNVNPHPCYRAGWNRCSCMMCIFGLPCHWAGIRELFPEEFERVCHDEEILDFTIDNKQTLKEYVGDAASCVIHDDAEAIQQLITGVFTESDVYVKEKWDFPAGAFRGAEGGPC